MSDCLGQIELTESESTSAATSNPGGVDELAAEVRSFVLVGERLLAAQAMRLLMRLDGEMAEARFQVNHDWFRRLMRARARAVSRLRRRWAKINPPPTIPLGKLRRRYHANLAKRL
ncbi:MAG TPA: hypothetical protein VES69_13095 [Pyrinomonadaceae bacterium]|jgi:hypothetical protein|nr:hypothetical protein [Pyrinomonadaceae bacterium]